MTAGQAGTRVAAVQELNGTLSACRLATNVGYSEELAYSTPVRAIGWSHLTNRVELGHHLGWSTVRRQQSTDTDFIIAAWNRWGPDCLSHLEGDFAFAVFDGAQLFAARDAMGNRPLFFTRSADALIVAATIPAIRSAMEDPKPDDAWLCRYAIDAHPVDGRTAIADVSQLLPGQCLHSVHGVLRLHQWHRFEDRAPWEGRLRDHWLHEYRRLLTEAVERRQGTPGGLGTESSGGLDSSSVLALMTHTWRGDQEQLASFSYFSTTHDWSIARLAATASGVTAGNIHLVEHPGLFGSTADWELLGHPVTHPNSKGHIPLFEAAAAAGTRTLFSGHGGDEAVTQAAWGLFAEARAHHAWPLIWRETQPGKGRTRRVVSILREREAESFAARRNAALRQRLSTMPFSARGLAVLGDVVALVPPSRWPRTINGDVMDGALVEASSRAAESSIVAKAFGLEYRFPLLDRKLVQQYLDTPSVWKRHNRYGRYLHRRAMSGLLPSEIIWASKPRPVPTAWPPIKRQHTYVPDAGLLELRSNLHPMLSELLDRRVLDGFVIEAERGGRGLPTPGARTLPELNGWLHHAWPHA